MQDFQQREIMNCFKESLLTPIPFINSSSVSTVIINYILRLQLSITRQQQSDSSRGSTGQLTCYKLVVHYIVWRKNKESLLVGWICMLQVEGYHLTRDMINQYYILGVVALKSGHVYPWNAITYSGWRLNVTRNLRDVMSVLQALYLLWSI